MPSSKLSKALCVLAVVSGPALAAEDPPATNQSKPIINKGTTISDGPASPTVINEGNFKPQPTQGPGLNPKQSKSGGGKANSNKGKMLKDAKGNVQQNRSNMNKGVLQNMRARTVPNRADNNTSGMSQTGRKRK